MAERNSKLFRQAALDRLSSPEQLDQILHVTGFHGWLALVAVFGVLAVAVVWGAEGSVISTASGEGLIVRRGGVLNVVARSAGMIVDLHGRPGDKVAAGELIATIAQPVLVEKLRTMRSALADAVRQREQSLAVAQNTSKLQVAAIEQSRASNELQINELEDRAGVLTQQIKLEEQLYQKGLVTHQQVLAMRQTLTGIHDQVQALRAQMKQYTAQEFVVRSQPEQADAPMRANIASLQRDLAGMEKELSMAERVTSPFAGEVLEIKVYPGSSVVAGQPLLSVQPKEASLELVAYVASAQAKDIRQGLQAQISPLNIKREEYGFMLGEVDYVADYPSTPEALMRNFENASLVQALTQAGPVSEIHVGLQTDSHTFSGYRWSTSQGPSALISSGTLCTVQIITKRQKPASLLLPYLRRKTGIS